MIEIRNLTKTYQDKNKPKTVLKDINLKLDKKGFVFISGKSGSGKSTLLNIIGGLDKFNNGDILIDGNSIKNYNTDDWDNYRNTYVGFIFQEFYLLEDLTVYENIALALELQGYNKETIKLKVSEVLKQVELDDFQKRKPRELSGGQKQRVAIARALIKNPKMLLCDEPTGNLDSETSDLILDLLKKLAKDRLVIMVTHEKEFAERYGDRIIELKDGVIIKDKIDNDEANEIYQEQTNEQLTTKNGNLSFKTTMKMAFHNFLSNKIKLVFMTLLFSISLLLVTIALHLSLYNYGQAAYSTFKENNAEFIKFVKTEYKCLNNKDKTCAYIDVPFSEDEINKFNSKYQNIKFYPITDVYRDLIADDNFSILCEDIAIIDNVKINVDYGTYPDNDNEILISDYIAELFVDYWGLSKLDDVVNKSFIYNNNTIEISGIINTDYTNFINNNKDNNKLLDKGNYLVFKQLFMFRETYDKFFRSIPPIKSLYFQYGVVNYPKKIMITSVNYVDNKNLIGKLPEKDNEIAVTINYLNKEINKNQDNDMTEFIGISSPFTYEVQLTNYEDRGSGTFETKNFTIVGVINDASINDYDIIFSDHGYINILQISGYYHTKGIAILGNNDRENLKFLKELETLKYRHITSYSYTLYDVKEFFEIVKIVLYSIGGIITVFTSLLIYSFISTNIKFKQKDIGILSSLGAKGKDVAKVFVTEGIIIVLIAYILGSILSIITINQLNKFVVNKFDLNIVLFYINIYGLILSFILSLLITFISSYMPIKKLTKIKPINVIKELA